MYILYIYWNISIYIYTPCMTHAAQAAWWLRSSISTSICGRQDCTQRIMGDVGAPGAPKGAADWPLYSEMVR